MSRRAPGSLPKISEPSFPDSGSSNIRNDSRSWRPRIRSRRWFGVPRLLIFLVVFVIPFGYLTHYSISNSQGWFRSPQGTPTTSSSKSPIQARHYALELCSDPAVPQPKPRPGEELPPPPKKGIWEKLFLDFTGLGSNLLKRHGNDENEEYSYFSYYTRTYTGTGDGDYGYSDYYSYTYGKPTPTPTADVSGVDIPTKTFVETVSTRVILPTVGGEDSTGEMRVQEVPGVTVLIAHMLVLLIMMGFGVELWG